MAEGLAGPGECGADVPLSLLDLLAEVTVAARLSGERERAYTVAKRALKLMERADAQDPLRAAWFWSQRSRLTEDLARGDGWEELSRARELVRGLPPSAAHAEVVALIAGWIMVHKSGDEGIETARRAVELARAAGDRDTELHARVTLGLLRADGGDVEGGIAEVEQVRRLVSGRHRSAIVARTYGNLSSVLEGAGRSREAVAACREGLTLLGEQAAHITRAWLLTNEGESLTWLGRYDEAAAPLREARRLVHKTFMRAGIETHLGFLAVATGDPDAAAGHHAVAQELLRHDTQPQHLIPIRTLAVQVAAAQGRFEDARTALAGGVRAGFPVGTARYAWPLLAAGATAEADAPAADPAALDLLADAAAALPRATGVAEAYALLVTAEIARARGEGGPALWAAVQDAFAAQERPVELARARFRHAEALLASGAPRQAAPLLAEALAGAEDAGACALAARIAGLSAPRGGAAPDPLGLTARERDVLRLVADGRTNRQIAEVLFISPKTASVHVSNILAKLSVATRGEAAAVAHRLALFS